MTTMSDTAEKFFEACETGRGWETCREFCSADATFSAQAEPLADVATLEDYCNWMKALIGFMPDGRYDLKSWAVDEERAAVSAFAVFSGTHTGEGGPCPPTGKSAATDYVYVMFFDDAGKIRHLTKIWHSWLAMQDLGWA